MSIMGKFHEVSFYGLCTTIFCFIKGYVTFQELWTAAFQPTGFLNIFFCYLFWASALFIPIAIIGAFSTKYADYGMGLSFDSDSILVIIFAHIAEEILGLISTPCWLLKDIFTRKITEEKVLDYVLYFVELVFIGAGLFLLISGQTN